MDADGRPLTDEPFPLDLVNTWWIDGGAPRDLLASDAGLRAWLDEHGFEQVPASETTRSALAHARSALRGVVDRPADPAAAAALDEVLRDGRLRLGFDGRPTASADVPSLERLPGWEAARQLLDILGEHPGRIRRCANEACVLVFLDTSRNGQRRWCSMASCGNRLKARRHWERSRSDA
jgi:predicted RNA-binding Zn ribbon-like protein